MELKKVAIIGPESTGKSTLSEQLAEQYNTQIANFNTCIKAAE